MNPTPGSDKTARTHPPSKGDSFSLEFDLQHSPEKVWRALTDPALLAEWLLPVVGLPTGTLEPGATFTFKTQPYPGWDGTVNCRILEFEAQRKLSYTWSVPFLDTVVTFTLTPLEPSPSGRRQGEGAHQSRSPARAGTRLTIVQSGFKPDQKQEFGGARYGWKMMGERLVDLLARMP